MKESKSRKCPYQGIPIVIKQNPDPGKQHYFGHDVKYGSFTYRCYHQTEALMEECKARQLTQAT